jgi:hypothetical protein
VYLDEAASVEFICVRDCIRAEFKEKEVRVACHQRSAREFARSVVTCVPGAVSLGSVVGLTVFTYAVSHGKTQDHLVAVYTPAGGPSKIARGREVMIEMHHDVNHVACDGLTYAALGAHEFMLVEDACEEGFAFWRVCPDRVKCQGSSMPWCYKSATDAERYPTSVLDTILEPWREFPSRTHWPYAARAGLTFPGPYPRSV